MGCLYKNEPSHSKGNAKSLVDPTPPLLLPHSHENNLVTSKTLDSTFPNKRLACRALPENRTCKSHSKHHAQLRDAPSTLLATHPRTSANSSCSPLLLLPAQSYTHHLGHARLLHRHAVDHVR